MAGMNKARSARGRYTAAGYNGSEMYIADVPAGSAQDDLLDYNKPGYRSERPWNETPEPLFEAERAQKKKKIAKKGKRSFLDRLILQCRREKGAFFVCAFCLTVMMMLGVANIRNLMNSRDIQLQIAQFDERRIELEKCNAELEAKLSAAQRGDRIRNEAQNKLNMLRPERADNQKIYVQMTDHHTRQTLQQNEEPRMELLDILLGLLNLFPFIGE